MPENSKSAIKTTERRAVLLKNHSVKYNKQYLVFSNAKINLVLNYSNRGLGIKKKRKKYRHTNAVDGLQSGTGEV